MPVITNHFNINAIPQKIVNMDPESRTVAFFIGSSGQIFIGPSNAVTPLVGFPIQTSTSIISLPIPPDSELWAVAAVQAISPVNVFVTISSGFLTDNELRATPLSISKAIVPLTPEVPTSATVSTTSIQVVPANVNRTGLVLINTSNGTISIGIDSNAAVINKGITLNANAIWEMDEWTFTTLAINAIASGSNKVLAIQEFS